jgi:hypothetical protein
MHRQISAGGIERDAICVRAIERGETEKEIAVDVRRGKNDLVEVHLSAQLGTGGDARQGAQESAIAHAMAMRWSFGVVSPALQFCANSTRKSAIGCSLASMLASSAG